MSFEGKNLYGQYIDYSEKKKKKWPKGFICPYTGTIFYIIRIYSRSQVSVYRTIGPLVLIFLIYLKKSQVGFFKKLICIREIPELQVDNEKVLSYRVRFPAISVQREVVVAEFSMFYARR